MVKVRVWELDSLQLRNELTTQVPWQEKIVITGPEAGQGSHSSASLACRVESTLSSQMSSWGETV